eukprot:7541054-Pyramimonas_sp.AAC.1
MGLENTFDQFENRASHRVFSVVFLASCTMRGSRRLARVQISVERAQKERSRFRDLALLPCPATHLRPKLVFCRRTGAQACG